MDVITNNPVVKMDEVNNVRQNNLVPQYSTCSFDSNGDELSKCDNASSYQRICFIGDVSYDNDLRKVAEHYNLPIVTSETGREFAQENNCSTIFVIDKFHGPTFSNLHKAKQPILGPPALRQLVKRNEPLPNNKTRPLYNLAMSGVVVCFTGFRNKDDLAQLVPLIHHMGGSIRKEMSAKVTHLIAYTCGGQKYHYAATFKVPVLNQSWVLNAWKEKYALDFSATNDSFLNSHKLKPFQGAHIRFEGFPEDEEVHMREVLEANGGKVCETNDPNCTHVVMDYREGYSMDAGAQLTSPTVNEPFIYPDNPTTPLTSTAVKETVDELESFSRFQTIYNTPLNSTTRSVFLETLDERSHDDISVLDQTLNTTTSSTTRKRKIESPEYFCTIKRKRDKSFSEKKKRVSSFFKTPINYFSQRRRTIHSTSFNESLNESVISSSGVFNVDTVQDLSHTLDSSQTPKKSKKNLLRRTFSSKFSASKKRSKADLNSSKYSLAEGVGSGEKDEVDKFNTSCFPAIGRVPALPSLAIPDQTEPSNELTRELRGLSVTSAAVVDESSVGEKPDANLKTWVVKAEWFWMSVQKQITQCEKDYLFDDYIEQVLSPNGRRDSHQATPSSASRRKRKRIHETIQSLVNQQSPTLHKRRSSVSDAGLLSVSGSFLDCTASPDKALLDGPEVSDSSRKGKTARHQVFLELLQTESNYVNILETIILMFKKHLEDMTGEEALLNNTEVNLIFGKIPPIYDVHVKMLGELRKTAAQWTEDRCIGSIIYKYANELLTAYPPFINYFEEMKEVLIRCDQTKPRFHAFLKACQTRPECGRQSLTELMIRPVQRLGSISLLLNDILKNTPVTNPDHAALEQAQEELKEIMTHINEDKRKTEGQVTLFNIFNEIDNCPPEMVSAHRIFIAKSEVIQLNSPDVLSSKGNNLVLFLFSDQLEVCKKKSKSFNSLKSPTGVSTSSQSKTNCKPYKHIRMMALNTIKKVIDIKETEDCQKVFSLVCRHNDEVKERLYCFAMADEDADKADFLKTLTKQMATNSCTADADKFMAYLEPQQLEIDTSDLSNGTLSKAFKFASRTKMKVGRAFSFNKTPSKLKRAVSSMMSPFGSSTNLTPANQLAQMKLASYSNINVRLLSPA
ncbi:protein ECT2 isoform X2 [Harmonia axyridis]|uniref:protein ECT2 isoform X2 n=1 Tax=Harmonia axyridis TaxID=115357 RepID=UPI001E2766CA|nr:protein ECT2 isoform X2 [Harmonia axyridis]XP_045471397.1 protein ECT2 isoform X2 [Harmonia axyridis]